MDWKDDEGWAPLHKACMEGNTDIVKLLIKHKANLNLRDGNGDTPLCVAAYVGFMGIVHALVEAGADITIYGDKHKTAAEQATEWKHELVANYLTTEAPRVQAGDADAIERAKKWWQGWPLYDACKKGNAMEAKRLIKEGAPIGWRGPNGWTPLHMASANDKKDVVVLLIESKADLDVADSVGNTPLIWATCDNHIQIVITLVQAGADTTVRGERNRTAAELAKVRKYDAVFQYLTTDAPLVQAQLKARVDTKKWKVSGQVRKTRFVYKTMLARSASLADANEIKPLFDVESNRYFSMKWILGEEQLWRTSRNFSTGVHPSIGEMKMEKLRCTWLPLMAKRTS